MLPKIQASTLLIWGENDTATPLWMGREMEKCISDAALVLFEGCSHFAYLEQYGRFSAIVKEFLED
jgi:pimeloyl-ACP methyl ester carboxylesterase